MVIPCLVGLICEEFLVNISDIHNQKASIGQFHKFLEKKHQSSSIYVSITKYLIYLYKKLSLKLKYQIFKNNFNINNYIMDCI